MTNVDMIPKAYGPYCASVVGQIPGAGSWSQFIAAHAADDFHSCLVLWGQLGQSLASLMTTAIVCLPDGSVFAWPQPTLRDIEQLLTKIDRANPFPELLNDFDFITVDSDIPLTSIAMSLDAGIRYRLLGKPTDGPLLVLEEDVLIAFGKKISLRTKKRKRLKPCFVFLWLLMEQPGRPISREDLKARSGGILDRDLKNWPQYATEVRNHLKPAIEAYYREKGETPPPAASSRFILDEGGSYKLALDRHQVSFCHRFHPDLA